LKLVQESQQRGHEDQERELLTFSTWTIHAHSHACKRLDIQSDLELAAQETLGAAHSVAHTEIIRRGQVWERMSIYRAIEGAPALFQTIYLDVLPSAGIGACCGQRSTRLTDISTSITSSLEAAAQLFEEAEPRGAIVGDERSFRVLAVIPVHFESACEWLERKGLLQKLPLRSSSRSAAWNGSKNRRIFSTSNPRTTLRTTIQIHGARRTTCKTSTWRFRATNWLSSPAC